MTKAERRLDRERRERREVNGVLNQDGTFTKLPTNGNYSEHKEIDKLTHQNLELADEIRELIHEQRELKSEIKTLKRINQRRSFEDQPDEIIYRYFLGFRIGSNHIFKNRNKE